MSTSTCLLWQYETGLALTEFAADVAGWVCSKLCSLSAQFEIDPTSCIYCELRATRKTRRKVATETLSYQ